jgi:predicted nucleic acid-binding protein
VSRFVVDASVVLTWCFPDENSAYAQRVASMFGRGDSAVAPSFWAHEVLNALLVGEKRKRISYALIDTFLADLAKLPVGSIMPPTKEIFGRVQELSRRYDLTAYDAAYLHLAELNGLRLATLDQDLIRACKQLGVLLV